MARKHKSLLGNGEAQFTGLDGFSHGDTGRWVDVHACVCMYPCLCVCVAALISQPLMYCIFLRKGNA